MTAHFTFAAKDATYYLGNHNNGDRFTCEKKHIIFTYEDNKPLPERLSRNFLHCNFQKKTLSKVPLIDYQLQVSRGSEFAKRWLFDRKPYAEHDGGMWFVYVCKEECMNKGKRSLIPWRPRRRLETNFYADF